MVQIITDSSCDLTQERLTRIGVVCAPLTVHFGNETYIDGENITAEEFFEFLNSHKEVPKTAQPTPHAFEEAFRAALDKGDEVLCILVGNKLSGTIQSANIAKNNIGTDKVRIIDSQGVCAVVGLLVEIAVLKIKEGLCGDALYEEMTRLSNRVRVYAAIDTLKYVRKGGRLSGAAALVGTMLNFYPILTTKDGLVVNTTKAKGKKRLYEKMKELVIADGVDTSYPFMFNKGIGDKNLEELKLRISEAYDISDIRHGVVGPVVGTFSGPGVVVVGFIKKEE